MVRYNRQVLYLLWFSVADNARDVVQRTVIEKFFASYGHCFIYVFRNVVQFGQASPTHSMAQCVDNIYNGCNKNFFTRCCTMWLTSCSLFVVNHIIEELRKT